MKSNYVITIGRQVGSGGSILGKALAEYFGFNYIDKELLRKVADELKVPEENIEWMDEKRPIIGSSMFQSSVYNMPYMSDDWTVPTGTKVFEIETKIIKQAAEEGPCVVIGRCGSYLFRDYPKHASIFLHADEKSRLARLKALDMPPEKAQKMIERADKDRARYFNTYTGKKWMDPTEYDLCINSGRLSEEQLKQIAIDYICQRFPELR